MELGELTPQENLCLIGLVKAIIQADKVYSDDEAEELKGLAKKMGIDLFNETVKEARATFKKLSDIKSHAAQITRQPARALIYSLLYDMARPDAVSPEEEGLLGWIAELWEITK